MTPDEARDILSPERFSTYETWAAAHGRDALNIYEWNIRLSSALYPSLQNLEVTLRNQIHRVISRTNGANWILNRPNYLTHSQLLKIEEVRNQLPMERKDQSPGQVIAGLSFGFWTPFFSSSAEGLWRTHLRNIVARPAPAGINRKSFSAPLDRIRPLRNRIAHHEPILHLPLSDLHSEIVGLTTLLHPASEAWRQRVCTFADTHQQFLAECPNEFDKN